MHIINEDVQDKMDALQATIDDLDDQLKAARDKGNQDKERSIQDRIDSTQERLDKLKNPQKESKMRVIKQRMTEGLTFQQRRMLVEEARENLEDAIDKIKRAVKGEGSRVESNVRLYLIPHLQSWVDGSNKNGDTVIDLIDHFSNPENDPGK